MIEFFDIRITDNKSTWGNVFLTESWVLYVDITNDQHDLAMQRLNIDPHSVLISGNFNQHGVSIRSSRHDMVCDDLYHMLINSVKEYVHQILTKH